MSKHVSPLLGYNNNVRHKGRVFHIQTEDSGIKRPHIITHLFMDGGRILKSIKTSYADHVGTEKMSDTVRAMMKEQHKAMFTALREGQFDHMFEGRPSMMPPPAASVPPPPMPPPALDPAPLTERDPEEPGLTLDLDSLGTAAVVQAEADLPPPPANLFREKEAGTGGRYRALRDPRVDPESSGTMRAAEKVDGVVPPERIDHVQLEKPKSRPPPSSRAEPKPASTRDRKRSTKPPAARPGSHPPRSAPLRPAASFGPAKPQSSIFGEDLISDKSLDEVILSYLAEDLEGEK